MTEQVNQLKGIEFGTGIPPTKEMDAIEAEESRLLANLTPGRVITNEGPPTSSGTVRQNNAPSNTSSNNRGPSASLGTKQQNINTTGLFASAVSGIPGGPDMSSSPPTSSETVRQNNASSQQLNSESFNNISSTAEAPDSRTLKQPGNDLEFINSFRQNDIDPQIIGTSANDKDRNEYSNLNNILNKLYNNNDSSGRESMVDNIDMTEPIRYDQGWRLVTRDGKKIFVKKSQDAEGKVSYNEYSKESPLTRDIFNKCVISESKSNPEECLDYINNCLLNDDANLDCLTNNKWPDISVAATRKEILDNMHPALALRILQKFGFKTKEAYDITNGRNILKVVNFNTWLKKLANKKFTEDQINQVITGKTNLQTYLNMLVDFVNANPKILNKHMHGVDKISETDETRGYLKLSSYLKDNGITMRKELSGRDRRLYDNMLLKYYLSNGWGQVNNIPFNKDQHGLFKGLSGRNLLGIGDLLSFQKNGGHLNPDDWMHRRIQSNMTTNRTSPVLGADLLLNVFKDSLSNMQYYNKTMDDNDKKNLFNQLKRMRELENNILKVLMYIQEYNRILAKNKDNSSKKINIEKMKDLVSKYKQFKNEHYSIEQLLSNILMKLSESDPKDKFSDIKF